MELYGFVQYTEKAVKPIDRAVGIVSVANALLTLFVKKKKTQKNQINYLSKLKFP